MVSGVSSNSMGDLLQRVGQAQSDMSMKMIKVATAEKVGVQSGSVTEAVVNGIGQNLDVRL